MEKLKPYVDFFQYLNSVENNRAINQQAISLMYLLQATLDDHKVLTCTFITFFKPP